MANGIIGNGTTIDINDGGAGAFVAWANVVDVDPNDNPLNVQESKRLNLTSRTVVKYLGVVTPGQISVTYEFTKAEYARIQGLMDAYAEKQFKITIPDGTPSYTKTVPGFIVSNKIQPVTADGIVLVVATIEVSGPNV